MNFYSEQESLKHLKLFAPNTIWTER